jgi:hypothetical protein
MVVSRPRPALGANPLRPLERGAKGRCRSHVPRVELIVHDRGCDGRARAASKAGPASSQREPGIGSTRVALSESACAVESISAGPYGTTITHIKGSVTVALKSIANPTSIPSCGGDCHSHVVQVFSASPNDRVDVNVHVDAYGGQSGTIHLTNLAFFGTAAKAVGKDLSIGVRNDNCGVGAVQGAVAELFSELGAYANPQFKWELTGATFPMGETGTHPTASVQVGDGPFTATLTVTDGSCVVSRRMTVTPLSVQQATSIEHICKLLQEYTLINLFWNPLGPDVRLPLTETNVLKIRAAAEQALTMTNSWLALQGFSHRADQR